MTSDAWDAGLYEQFKRERSQPFHDLLALVQPRPGMRIADLGCGTGELTRQLHEHLAAATTVGIDNSESMLAASAACAAEGLRFVKADIRDFAAESEFDLVFSNAALQWIPDHEALFRRLRDGLADGGQLAVQLPAMDDGPVHRTAAELAAQPPFREELAGFVHRLEVLAPERYAELLYRLGFGRQHVRLQVYGHVLPSRDAVVDWVRGTLLTAYRSRLSAESYDRFVAAYRDRLVPALPDERPFFFPYKRILMWAGR